MFIEIYFTSGACGVNISTMAGNEGVFKFRISPIDHRESPHFRVQESHYHLHGQRTGNFRTVADMNWGIAVALRNAINTVLQDRTLNDQDWLWFKFSAPNKEKDFTGAGLRVREWRNNQDNKASAAINDVVNGLQSNDSFMENERFDLAIVWADAESQGRGIKPGSKLISSIIKNKKCVVPIHNQDDLCLATALALAIARLMETSKNYTALRKSRRKQEVEAKKLHFYSGIPEGPCGIAELQQFQHYLKDDFRIIVCYGGSGFKCEAFTEPGKPEIYLLHVDEHYHLITSMDGFLGTAYFCSKCLKGYQTEGEHKCRKNKEFCTSCRQENCLDHLNKKEEAGIYCSDCNLMFKGQNCFSNHKTFTVARHQCEGKSVCDTVKACRECGKFLKNMKEIQYHRCGYLRCPHCKKNVDYRVHKCFIQTAAQEEAAKKRKRPVYQTEDDDESDEEGEEPVSLEEQLVAEQEGTTSHSLVKRKKKLPTTHVYFDSECRFDANQHTPTLLVYWNEQDPEPVSLRGEDCVNQFLQYLEELCEEFNVTVLAHNFKGYDGLFVLRECYRNKLKVDQIRQGLKLLMLKHSNIRYIDSMSFIQGSLRAFNSTFGIPQDEVQKGYFPYRFYTKETEQYVGPLPEKHYYGPEHMSVSERPKFDAWYQAESLKYLADPCKVFDLQSEMLKYCISDVKLLKAGCEIFRKGSEEIIGLNPFDSTTIAASCLADIKKNHLPENKVAAEPILGWRSGIKTQSSEAKQWLLWEEKKLGRQIRSALNEGEFNIVGTKYHVDGYDPQTRTCYEYNGCFWHGCRSCFPNRDEKHLRLADRSMEAARKDTEKKKQALLKRGFKVKEIWGCEWHDEKQNNQECLDYVKTLQFVESLNPRHSFFGGRTNATKLYHQCQPGEKIEYADIVSEYPTVLKYRDFPAKHPEILVEPGTTDISQWFGIIKCKVLPPRQLYHPVLPVHAEGKLLFPLCQSCIPAELEKASPFRCCTCPHSDKERTILGTWCSPELQKAVEKGYQILHVYEVHHFTERLSGFCPSYIDKWMAVKAENSKLPSWVQTKEDKEQFAAEYQSGTGISLDPAKLNGENKGLRQIGKIRMNSSWGRFAMRANKAKTVTVTSMIELHNYLNSDKHEFKAPRIIDDQTIELTYVNKEEDAELAKNTNIYVASFTTCWGRLMLYEALDILGERVLYYDTDSVIYVRIPGMPDLKFGNKLGEWESEMSGGDHIEEFVSAGPKNYGYRTFQGKTELKVKGFSLNCEGAGQLQYGLVRDNIIAEIKDPLVVDKSLKRPQFVLERNADATRGIEDVVLAPNEKVAERRYPIINSCHFKRDMKEMSMATVTQEKQYGLVYTKRVIDRETFKTYPYGYA